MTKPTEYLNAAAVRRRYGDISDMSLWRWQHHPTMNFPAPVYFGRLRFWRIADLEAWERKQPGAQPIEAA